MSAGHFITGSSESVTTILNEHAEVFPEASVAMEFTVVVPTGNTDPEDGFEITEEEQLSVDSMLKFTTALHEPESVFTFIVPGQVITGSSLSVTVTVNVQVDVLPAASVAVDVTEVVPIGKIVPEAGVELTDDEEQLSVEVTLKFTIAPQAPGSEFTFILPGQIITGSS